METAELGEYAVVYISSRSAILYNLLAKIQLFKKEENVKKEKLQTDLLGSC